MKGSDSDEVMQIQRYWRSERWAGITRAYKAEDVASLRGSVRVEHTLAKSGAEKLWRLLQSEPYVRTLGTMTGNQAVQVVLAGLKAVYLSGWQVAADSNLAGQTYPDLSLYPANSGPALVKRLNQALLRADQIDHMEGRKETDWMAPIVADAEAGFGGPLNVYELVRSMIEAGVAGLHLEDQTAAEKKCGHMGGKVIVPTSHFVRTITAARLASDVLGVPTVIVARTDSRDSSLITSDVDERDRPFLTGERTPEGYFRIDCGLDLAISRALAYAPYADMLWFETHEPDIDEARRFAGAIHKSFPGKMLAYNLSPSFNWDKLLDAKEQERFQGELGALGYKLQFVTLAGFHSLNQAMFELAKGYADEGLPAYVELQRKELGSEKKGYTAARHQSFVGAGYFDRVLSIVSGGASSTTSMDDSTEARHFDPHPKRTNVAKK